MAEIVELRPSNIADIPAALERIAAQIRDGEWGDVDMAVCVLMSPDGPEVFGLGRDADGFRSIGLLQIGSTHLARMIG